MLPSSFFVVLFVCRRRHSMSCSMVVNCEKMMDFCDALSFRSRWRSWTRSSILDDEVQFSNLMRLIIDDFLTSISSCSISTCSRSIDRGMWQRGQSGSLEMASSELDAARLFFVLLCLLSFFFCFWFA